MSEMVEEIAEAMGAELTAEELQWVKEEIAERWNADVPAAMERQVAAAAAISGQELRARDGIGELVMQVDSAIYWWWERKLPGCWKDRDFRKWFGKNFPEAVVKCKGTKSCMVLMPGLRKG